LNPLEPKHLSIAAGEEARVAVLVPPEPAAAGVFSESLWQMRRPKDEEESQNHFPYSLSLTIEQKMRHLPPFTRWPFAFSSENRSAPEGQNRFVG
jgi:hypothetical protein